MPFPLYDHIAENRKQLTLVKALNYSANEIHWFCIQRQVACK